MNESERHPLFSGVTSTSLGTLASRVLGVVRESAAAGLLGLSKDGIMDAYVVAFRIPNLFRRLFGEGAMTASYLPVFTADLERDRRSAWRLASAAAVLLAATLVLLTLAAEGICGLLWLIYGDSPGMRLSLGLTATMLPYTVFICLAALAAATLQSLGEFRLPALVPSVLNICWLVGAWFIAPRITADRQGQAYIMAGCVLVGGVLQLLVQLPALRRLGFRFDFDYRESRRSLGRILRTMAPTTLGLAVTQINTLSDSLIARGFAAAPGGPTTIGWLGGVAYPLKQGAAAAVWYGERVYQFPLGLLGIAVATVIFPLLSRHAAQGQLGRVGSDLTLGLRLVLFGGVPAAAGLFLLAEPFARLLFERQNFTSADTSRAAAMIAAFAVGVWAVLRRAGARASVLRSWRSTDAGVDRAAGGRRKLRPEPDADLAARRSGAGRIDRRGGDITSRTLGVRVLPVALPTRLAATLGHGVANPRFDGGDVPGGHGRLGMSLPNPVTPATRSYASPCRSLPAIATYFAAYWLARGPELRMLIGRQPEPSSVS